MVVSMQLCLHVLTHKQYLHVVTHTVECIQNGNEHSFSNISAE